MHKAMIIGTTLLAFAGCSTVAGFGQDLADAGNALTSASREAAGPAPKKQTATRAAPRKTTPTRVAATSTSAKSTAAKSTAAKPVAAKPTAKNATITKAVAKAPAKQTTKKVVAEPAKAEVVDTGKPFKPGK